MFIAHATRTVEIAMEINEHTEVDYWENESQEVTG